MFIYLNDDDDDIIGTDAEIPKSRFPNGLKDVAVKILHRQRLFLRLFFIFKSILLFLHGQPWITKYFHIEAIQTKTACQLCLKKLDTNLMVADHQPPTQQSSFHQPMTINPSTIYPMTTDRPTSDRPTTDLLTA